MMNSAEEIPASVPSWHRVHLDGEAPPLGPAQIHPQQHLGPVLGVGAALPRLDLADCVALVVFAREQRPQLELVETAGKPTQDGSTISSSTSESSSARGEFVEGVDGRRSERFQRSSYRTRGPR